MAYLSEHRQHRQHRQPTPDDRRHDDPENIANYSAKLWRPWPETDEKNPHLLFTGQAAEVLRDWVWENSEFCAGSGRDPWAA